MTEAQDEFDASIDAKMRQADGILPWTIRGPFAKRRYADMHGSFINLRDDSIYNAALHDLITVAALYEKDGNQLSDNFWELIDELAVDVGATDDYRIWRTNI